MALNFPVDTSRPYIDSSSGLKYIFNRSVGAWESAIQPPVIISSSPPSINTPGFLYWDKDDGVLYIYYEDGSSKQWVPAVPAPNIPKNHIGATPPKNPTEGQLWFDTVSGRLYIWYSSAPTKSHWVDASPADMDDNTNNPVIISPTAPTNPGIGKLWWNTNDGNLYVWYVDPNSGSSWVTTNTTSIGAGDGASKGISKIIATEPIYVTGTNEATIGIRDSTTTQTGVSRSATTADILEGKSNNSHITPSSLSSALPQLIPTATQGQSGIIEIATQTEVNAGTDTQKAITPATLKEATRNPSNGVPTGCIMMWPTLALPSGWISCEGQSTGPYPALRLIVGDNVPDLRKKFVRGYSDREPGNNVGKYVPGQNKQHNHDWNDPGHVHGIKDDGHVHQYSIRSEQKKNVEGGNGAEVVYDTDASQTSTSRTGANISVNKNGSDITFRSDGVSDGPYPDHVILRYIIKT